MDLWVIRNYWRQLLWFAETFSQVSKKWCKDYCMMGILMEDPSSPWFPLNHPLYSQSDKTPPSITTHPYRPTAKSYVVPHQV